MRNEALTRRTRGRGRRTLATIAAIGVFGTVSTTTSASVPTPTAPADAAAKRATFVYTVSDDGDFLWPEGIAVQDNTYYVTGFGSGTIYRGDLDAPEVEAEVFIPGNEVVIVILQSHLTHHSSPTAQTGGCITGMSTLTVRPISRAISTPAIVR